MIFSDMSDTYHRLTVRSIIDGKFVVAIGDKFLSYRSCVVTKQVRSGNMNIIQIDRVLHATQRIALYVAFSVFAVAGTLAAFAFAAAYGIGLVDWP